MPKGKAQQVALIDIQLVIHLIELKIIECEFVIAINSHQSRRQMFFSGKFRFELFPLEQTQIDRYRYPCSPGVYASDASDLLVEMLKLYRGLQVCKDIQVKLRCRILSYLRCSYAKLSSMLYN